jgi:predicted unusual protein kinase regulating ubiquinone biosynthesis (AarF/ABC1/UbiB family)
MLLDTGTLHCDPHPGNLLRTRDGKLCILDFGMCLDVPTDLQLALLEFIANLQAEAYERVPEDLVKLGFVPPDKLDDLRASGLTYVYRAANHTREPHTRAGGATVPFRLTRSGTREPHTRRRRCDSPV